MNQKVTVRDWAVLQIGNGKNRNSQDLVTDEVNEDRVEEISWDDINYNDARQKFATPLSQHA